MTELRIVATILIKEEYKNELIKAFHTVVDATRKEAGCIAYDLYENTDNSLKFTILEIWKDEKAIELHNNSAHFDEFKKAIDGKIESLSVDVIKQVY